MKTYILTLLLLCMSNPSFAQCKDLFREFRKEPCAEYIMIPSYLTAIGKMFLKNTPEARIAKKMKSIRILDMEQCPEEVRHRFNQRVNTLHQKGYEMMIRINEDGEQMRIYARIEKECARELLIACSEDDECTLVQITGKLSKEDIKRLIDDQLKNKNGRE